MRAVRFSLDDAIAAADGHFNCGPAALCAVADLRPNEALLHLGGFDRKHYVNPTMMRDALGSLKIPFRQVHKDNGTSGWTDDGIPGVGCVGEPTYPDFGLVRIQWGGPWTKPGVPIAARYRHTHWIAVEGEMRFDVNAMCVGGWIPLAEWETQLVPWLLKECEPKASGGWWPTHCWQIEPDPERRA